MNMSRTIEVGQRWKHFKGTEYKILGVSSGRKNLGIFVSYWAQHEATKEILGIFDTPRDKSAGILKS